MGALLIAGQFVIPEVIEDSHFDIVKTHNKKMDNQVTFNVKLALS